MQDRYAGDVGDFIKIGLLRHIAADGMSVGLNWYLAPDETHNADGMHIAYLESAAPKYASLRDCDPGLVIGLSRLVHGERSVGALERSGTVPLGSRTYRETLNPLLGQDGRRAWHSRALAALVDSQVIFADPDNGIRTAPRGRTPHKFAFVTELADYAKRGQSIIAYHHMGRKGDAPTQARHRLEELASGVSQAPVGAIIGRRGSCRFFLVTADDAHHDELQASIGKFAARWSPHVELVQ